jgi:MFS family permease
MTNAPAAAPGESKAPKDFGADFWKFLSAQTISSLGSSFTMFALPLLVFKITGSAINLALVTAAEYLPYLLFGLVAGAVVDRTNRRKMMIRVDVMQAAVISTIPILAALGQLAVWWIYIVGFVSSTLWILFNAAEFAAIPSLVNRENLVAANGRLQASYSAASVAGPLLAGLLVAVAPISAVLVLDAVSFLLSALLVFSIKKGFEGGVSDERPSRLRSEVLGGLRYVMEHRVLRNACLMMALVNCVGFTVYAQLVLFAKERLGATDPEVAFLFAAGGVGMILLALVAGPLRRRLSFSRVTLGSVGLGGIFIVLLSMTERYWPAVVLWALIWGLVILFQINTNSLWQEITPNRLLGRVQTVVSALSWSAIPLGAFVGGVAIEQTGSVALVYGTIGVLILLAAAGFSFTSLGRAERYLPRKEPA